VQDIVLRVPDTQVIFVTGYPTLENALAALNAGAMDYLVKPFDQAELVEYVNRRHGKLGEISQQRIPKILLVDDSHTMVLLFKSLFKKSGYDVTFASDGEKGFQMALESKPDLVLLDGELPVLDGFEVCRRLRLDERMKSTKIVMFTGGTVDVETNRAHQAGADLFLSKSAKPADILESVRQLLEIERRRTDAKV